MAPIWGLQWWGLRFVKSVEPVLVDMRSIRGARSGLRSTDTLFIRGVGTRRRGRRSEWICRCVVGSVNSYGEVRKAKAKFGLFLTWPLFGLGLRTKDVVVRFGLALWVRRHRR